MEVNKEMEKQYTLLIEGLTLEEKSWLYAKAKRESSNQGNVVLGLIRKAILEEE